MAGRLSKKKEAAAIRLTLPSQFGFEKIAMDAAATIAEVMGFTPVRVEDLRTAVSEACINAMEHGNKLVARRRVELVLIPGRGSLKVQVHDCGKGFKFAARKQPNIARKLAGQESPRGWGLYLIERLVDHVEFNTLQDAGHVTTMTMKLGK
jgi:serine/threonine-protein kinase RsbW